MLPWQPVEFEPGELVLRQGAACQNPWVVLACSCLVLRQAAQAGSAPVVLAELETGAQFGEMTFFRPAPHSASVRAKTRLQLLGLARNDFDDLVAGLCAVAYKLAVNTVAGLAQRLRTMDAWVSELVAEELAVSHAAGLATQREEWLKFKNKMFSKWNL